MNEVYTAAEILSASSAIQAAHIQADATIQAAWWAAGGIVLGLIVSWLTSLTLQKNSRVAETRREIYVEAVAAYSKLTSVMASIHIDPKTAFSRYLEAVEHFALTLDKAMFVCETTTKSKIVDFYEVFIPTIETISLNLGMLVEKYDDLEFEKNSHEQIMDQLSKIWEKLDDFSIENPLHEKIQNTLDLINSKIAKSALIVERIEEAETAFIEERKNIIDNFNTLYIQLNDQALDAMYLLRQEIGIKNNITLDKILNERLKNIANRHEQK